ncbi:MAG TPA: DUF3078 domain-containing protein [Anseongella sp.]|nr:DUF3078 domain-containing protein [Anseongella sp.]
MKKFISALAFAGLFAVPAKAQEADTAAAPWKVSGVHNLLFNQASFSNWSAGGQNSLALNALFDYNFNYKKGQWSWDTKLKAGYGISNIDDFGWRKSEDIININSFVGRQANQYWLYSFFLDFQSQFAPGYNYASDGARTHISGPFAPAFIQFGPGMAYKRSDNFYFNISPAASKLIIVNDDALSARGAFGVDTGETMAYQFGATAMAYLKFDLVKNVTLENKLLLFSNYLEDARNVDIDNQLNLNMKINDYLTTYFGLQLIYDDNILLPLSDAPDNTEFGPQLQLKQLFGAGFTYKFPK